MFNDKMFNHMPEPATMFLQRKFAGIFMLCRRLRAQVDLGTMLAPYLATDDVTPQPPDQPANAHGSDRRLAVNQ
jgi:hypothetical protein